MRRLHESDDEDPRAGGGKSDAYGIEGQDLEQIDRSGAMSAEQKLARLSSRVPVFYALRDWDGAGCGTHRREYYWRFRLVHARRRAQMRRFRIDWQVVGQG